MKRIVLFDIDGTLADIKQRRSILEENPHNWAQFFQLMGDDSPNQNIVELYSLIQSSQQYECIIVSGRPEQYRQLTEKWLTWNGIEFERLFMRQQDDNRADHIIKEEILDRLLSEGKEIAFVVDDRKSVVDMWRRRGLTCLQCADYDG